MTTLATFLAANQATHQTIHKLIKASGTRTKPLSHGFLTYLETSSGSPKKQVAGSDLLNNNLPPYCWLWRRAIHWGNSRVMQKSQHTNDDINFWLAVTYLYFTILVCFFSHGAVTGFPNFSLTFQLTTSLNPNPTLNNDFDLQTWPRWSQV